MYAATCVIQQSDAKLAKMVRFIENEANERVNEITINAKEDSNSEKLRLIETERNKIETQYEKRSRAALRKVRIAHSRGVNKAKMVVLEKQQELLDNVPFTVLSQLSALASSPEYPSIVAKLIVAGAKALGDGPFMVQCRPGDIDAVQKAIETAKAELDGVELSVDPDVTLPSAAVEPKTMEDMAGHCCGGVIIANEDRTISVNNTFDARVDIVMKARLDKIRGMLFSE